MSPSTPSFWKNYRIAIIAVLAMLGIFLVWYRNEQNRKDRERLQMVCVVCQGLNEFVYGIDYPFAPSDLADRRRVIIDYMLGSMAHPAGEFDDELRTDLKTAIRLKLAPDEIAQIAHAAGDLPLAEKAARQFLESPEARQPESRVVLGDILCSAKKYAEAEAEYRKVAPSPNNIDPRKTNNPCQRLARFYADENTCIPASRESGEEIPKPQIMRLRRRMSLEFWSHVLPDVGSPESKPLQLPDREKTFIANADIQIGNLLRDNGHPAEARSHYTRALALYRRKDGSETENTKSTQRLLDALPAPAATPDK